MSSFHEDLLPRALATSKAQLCACMPLLCPSEYAKPCLSSTSAITHLLTISTGNHTQTKTRQTPVTRHQQQELQNHTPVFSHMVHHQHHTAPPAAPELLQVLMAAAELAAAVLAGCHPAAAATGPAGAVGVGTTRACLRSPGAACNPN